jgi:uncharacterized protein (TIGR04255 family)
MDDQVSAPTKTLQELVIASHFQATIPLGVMDLADWVSHFGDYPVVQQLPQAPPANVLPAGQQIAFGFGGPELPRMFLRSPDGRYSVQFQQDRFAIGWQRIEPPGTPAAYPGFPAMLQRWDAALDRFLKWTEAKFGFQPVPRLAEVSYLNAALLEQNGVSKRISEVFRFVQPSGRRLNAFNTSWIERLYPNDPPDVQRGTITAVVGLSHAPPAIPALAFNYTGLGVVENGQESKHIVNQIHDRIREIYQGSIFPDAV